MLCNLPRRQVCVLIPLPVCAVESDNKKETKGGKGNKGKGDQSPAIKVVSSVN